MGKVGASASFSPHNGIGVSTSAETMYGTMYFKIPIGDHTLRIGASANIGGIGAKFKLGLKTEIGFSFIGGGSVIVKWD